MRHIKRLQTIKEDDARGDKYQNKHEGSQSSHTNKSEKEDGNSDDILRKIEHTFKRKVNILKKKKRQTQSKIVKIRPPCASNQIYLFG